MLAIESVPRCVFPVFTAAIRVRPGDADRAQRGSGSSPGEPAAHRYHRLPRLTGTPHSDYGRGLIGRTRLRSPRLRQSVGPVAAGKQNPEFFRPSYPQCQPARRRAALWPATAKRAGYCVAYRLRMRRRMVRAILVIESAPMPRLDGSPCPFFPNRLLILKPVDTLVRSGI